MDKPQQILIIGCPRSGTSLLQTLVTTCFAGTFMPPEFENRPRSYFWSKVWPDVIRRAQERGVEPPTVVVWKIPEMPFGAPANYELLRREGVHTIGLVRHPRAVALSHQHGKPYWKEVAPHLFGGPLRANPYQHWAAMANHLLMRLRAGDPAFTLLRYEDLLAAPDDAQTYLAERTGLEPTVPFSTYHEHVDAGHRNAGAMNKVRPLDPERAAIPTNEDVEAAGHEPLPDMLKFAVAALGYEAEPGPADNLSPPIADGRVYAIGRGETYPQGWALAASPGDEGLINLDVILDALVCAQWGVESEAKHAIEGPCPLPGHDHPVRYEARGQSPIYIGYCEQTRDWIAVVVRGEEAQKARALPEAK